MKNEELEKIIIDCLPSRSLKKSIKEKKHKFSEEELLAIAYKYSLTFNKRLELLKLISENFSEKTKHWAEDCIKYQKKLYDAFIKSEDDYVFELHIINEPRDYEERYLCKNYEAVLKEIEFFHKCYKVKKSKEAYISVVKRKVSDCKSIEDFTEDNFGQCLLTAEMEIKTINIWSLENEKKCSGGVCMDCKDICIDVFQVNYPSFVKNMDIVMYYELNKKNYGVALVYEDYACYDDTVYIFPLDSKEMGYKDYDKIEMTHKHICSPLIEVQSFLDLNEELKENYLNFKESEEKKQSDKI